MSTITPVNVWASPNDNTWDTLRDWFIKVNTNIDNLNTDKLEASDISDLVTWPFSATNNAIAIYNWPWGKDIKNWVVTQTNAGILQNVESMDFSLNPADTTHTPWRLRWNKDEHTLDLDTDFTWNTLQLNQETVIPFINNTGSTIPNGTAVRSVWADAQWMVQVVLAQSDNIDNIKGTLFVTTTDTLDIQEGMLTKFGKVRGIDTSSFSVNDNLYISPTIAGWLTNIKPSFPNFSIRIGWVATSAVNWVIWINQNTFVSDTFHEWWDWAIRETFDLRVTSDWATIIWSLVNADLTNDLTLIFSDWLTIFDVTPAKTITLTAWTATALQDNYIFIPKSTKVLTISTSWFPTDEHAKVAFVSVLDATSTQSNKAIVNQNWNDEIKVDNDNWHILHISERIRQDFAKWSSWVQWVSTIAWAWTEVFVSNTGWFVYQLHKQEFTDLDTQVSDVVHIANDFTAPFKAISDLSWETTDALGNNLLNSSFSFVFYWIQNKTWEQSQLMINKPIWFYGRLSPSDAVTDAFNFSVYDSPTHFKSTWFLIARFTYQLTAWWAWTLFDTENLRWKVPNTTAWWGGSWGGWATEWTALNDTPASLIADRFSTVDSWGTSLELVKVVPAWVVIWTTDTQTLTNKTLTTPVINSPTWIVKWDVWLGNVDNTSDITKDSAVATLTNKNLTSWTNSFPILNQNTTWKSASTDALESATTKVNVSSATAPTLWQVLTAVDDSNANWQTSNAVNSVAWTPTWWDRVANVISLTTAEYNAASKVASTLYIITDA